MTGVVRSDDRRTAVGLPPAPAARSPVWTLARPPFRRDAADIVLTPASSDLLAGRAP
jgi:hypothetical protein